MDADFPARKVASRNVRGFLGLLGLQAVEIRLHFLAVLRHVDFLVDLANDPRRIDEVGYAAAY
jgi:hypothetical protein